MSSLKKNILSFKKSLSERNILTEDDITELESHILDKVDDLKQNGFNEDDAFDKAVSDLGPIDEIAAEYSKVNLSANVKFMLLCFGFLSINFLLSIIYLISISISYFIHNINLSYDNSIFDPLESLYNGQPNYPSLFIMLINIAFILLLLYFALKKSNSLLSMIAEKVLVVRSSKPVIKIAVSLLIISIPLLLKILISFMFVKLPVNMTFTALQNKHNCIFVNFALLLVLLIRYMKSRTSYSASSYMILGYLIITAAIRLIPSLILIISVLMNQYNILCISILFIAFFVITCCLIKLLSKRKILENKPNIIAASILLVVFIGSYFIHPLSSSLDYTLYNDCMLKHSYLSSAVQYSLNLLAAIALFSDYKTPFSRKRSIE